MTPVPRRILITGANGLLGRALQQALRQHQLTPLGRDQLDISQYDQLLAKVSEHQPDIIINCAAYTDVEAAESHAGSAYATNAFASALLAHLCQLRKIWLVHLSTDFVFDGRTGNYPETATCQPINVYGASKRAGEILVQRLCAHSTILRTAWLFGEGRDNFVSKIMRRLQAQAPCAVVDNHIGSPTAASDLAHAIQDLIETNALPQTPDIFHFAGAPAVSRWQWANFIWETLRHQPGCASLPPPLPTSTPPAGAPRPANSSLNSDKLAHLLTVPPSDWQTATVHLIQDEPFHASNR